MADCDASAAKDNKGDALVAGFSYQYSGLTITLTQSAERHCILWPVNNNRFLRRSCCITSCLILRRSSDCSRSSLILKILFAIFIQTQKLAEKKGLQLLALYRKQIQKMTPAAETQDVAAAKGPATAGADAEFNDAEALDALVEQALEEDLRKTMIRKKR